MSPACTRARGRGAGLPGRRRRRDRADRARAADAERRRRAPPLRLEPLQLRLPRPGSLAPDRAGLPLVADPHRQRRGRPAPAADREGDRAGGTRREDRLHAPAHRALHAGRQHRHQHARRRRRKRRRRVRSARRARPSRSRAAGRTAASPLRSTTTSGTSRARTSLISSEFGEPNAYEKGFDLDDVAAGHYGQRLHFWNLERATARADGRPRRDGASSRSRSAGSTTPRRSRASSAPRSRARCGASIATTAAGRPTR